MPRWVLNLLLLLVALEVVSRFWRRTGRGVRRFPERAPVVGALRGMLVMLVGAMLMNAFGMVSGVLVQNVELMNEGIADPVRLLRGPAAMVVGSWGLFSLIAASMTRGVFTEDHGDVAVLRGTVSALEAMLKRFALPLVGIGTVFGVAGEGLVLLVLFVELFLVWAFLRGYLFVRQRAER